MRLARHELQALLIIVVAIMLVAIAFSFYWAQSQQRALVNTLEFDLRGVYQRVLPEKPQPQSAVMVRPQAIADALSQKAGRGEALPSFVTPEQVYLPLQPVPVPSDHLLCVVDIGGGHFFGISGRGKFRAVTAREMNSWAHELLPRVGGQTPAP